MENRPVLGKAAVVFVFATVLIDMIGFGLIAPVLPGLVVQFSGGDKAQGSAILGLFGTVFALMQFGGAPVLGALSDRFGRKPVLVLSSLGLGLDYAVMALAPNLRWLFIGRLISGITSSSVSTAAAYVADVSPPEKRAAGFGMLGAAFGLGFIIGPAIGGLLGGFNSRLPFWCAAALGLLGALYGFFLLPESLPAERRRAFAWSRANPLGALKLLRSHRELSGLSIVGFCSVLASGVMPAVWVIYAGQRYGWDARAVGLSLAWVGLTSAVVQMFLVRPIVARFGERNALLAGLGAAALSVALCGLASTTWLFLLATPIMMFWGLVPAAAQSIMSRRVGVNEQGALQGALGSIRSVAAIISPGIFNLTYTAALGPLSAWHLPGLPWFVAMAILFVGIAVGAAVTRPAHGAKEADAATAAAVTPAALTPATGPALEPDAAIAEPNALGMELEIVDDPSSGATAASNGAAAER
jgi:MFS transporter, DHA1 family, tetracycline resistance protein